MTPYFFERGSRRLFGAFHPAVGKGSPGAGVIFCNPFGQEAVRSHRMYRVLAERAARVGVAALRFDYSSTGDSSGSCAEASLANWIEDVRHAERDLLTRSGVTQITWLGVRLGATIATLAASAPSEVDRRLVLWDPVINGAQYLEDLARAHIGFLSMIFRWSPRRIARSRGIANLKAMQELVGFEVTAALRSEIAEIDLGGAIGIFARSVTLLGEHGPDRYTRLSSALSRCGVATQWIPLESDIPWDTEEALNASTIPARTLDELMSAIENRS